ncbi:MAG: hypothetical protein Ct9H90mP7_5170 [Candidatus Neomarinimicrobiota bacterium]|nr:MAG: hypothetical protein Ct9H90mP7_5170 [Candidatus Neomarinimicrobiota bacterium]
MPTKDRDFILFEKSDGVWRKGGVCKRKWFIFDVGFQVYNTAYKTTNELLDIDVKKFWARVFTWGQNFCKGKSTILSDP